MMTDKKPPPPGPYSRPMPRPYGDPRGVGVSYERASPERRAQTPVILHGSVFPDSGHPTRVCIPRFRPSYTGPYPQIPVILHGSVFPDSGHPTRDRIPEFRSSYTGLYPQIPVILHGTVPPDSGHPTRDGIRSSYTGWYPVILHGMASVILHGTVSGHPTRDCIGHPTRDCIRSSYTRWYRSSYTRWYQVILHGTVPPDSGHPTRDCTPRFRSSYTGLYQVILHATVSPEKRAQTGAPLAPTPLDAGTQASPAFGVWGLGCGVLGGSRRVDTGLPGKGSSNSHGARLVR
ncbi:hypothetical protein T484DRAFT_2704759 [Baffinella frigidus]|nr:hypothetical protein T484DRAFT_2704759 [Cryptophyta sp. CCMP2293]